VRKAIEVLIQYIGLHSDVLCSHLEEEDRVVTIGRVLSGGRVRTRQALELAVAMFYRIIETFLGYALQPQEVAFPTTLRTIRNSTGVSLVRGCDFNWDYDGIVCRAADLEKSIPASDPAMARYLKEYFDSSLPSARSEVSETARELGWVLFRWGTCSAERVAKHLEVDAPAAVGGRAHKGESEVCDGQKQEARAARPIRRENRSKKSEKAALMRPPIIKSRPARRLAAYQLASSAIERRIRYPYR